MDLSGERAESSDVVRLWVRKALACAVCEPIDDPGDGYFARTPRAPGAWSTGATPALALAELESVLAGWAAVRLDRGLEVPGLEDLADAARA